MYGLMGACGRSQPPSQPAHPPTRLLQEVEDSSQHRRPSNARLEADLAPIRESLAFLLRPQSLFQSKVSPGAPISGRGGCGARWGP